MKKITILLLIFPSLTFISSKAQEQKPDYNAYAPKKFFSEIEFYAGPGIGYLRGSAAVSNNSNKRKIKIGHSYGIGLVHKIGKKLHLNNKLLFERKGGVSEVTGTYFDQTTQTYNRGKSLHDYTFNYYTLSVAITRAFDEKNRFRVGAGPYVSYLGKQTLQLTNLFNGSIGNINDQTEYYAKFDFGISTLICYQLPFSSKFQLNFQLLSTLGFANVILNPYENMVMNTTSTSFLIGFISKCN